MFKVLNHFERNFKLCYKTLESLCEKELAQEPNRRNQNLLDEATVLKERMLNQDFLLRLTGKW